MLDNEPMILGYRGKIESAGVCIQDTRRRDLIGDASGVVDTPRQRGFRRGIDDNDVAGRRRGACGVNGRGKSCQARGERGGDARCRQPAPASLFTLLDCLLANFAAAGENNISHLSCSIITGFALATTAGVRASMEMRYFWAMSPNGLDGFTCFRAGQVRDIAPAQI